MITIYSADLPENYIKTKRVVYNADCEIISFTLEFLSKNTSTD